MYYGIVQGILDGMELQFDLQTIIDQYQNLKQIHILHPRE